MTVHNCGIDLRRFAREWEGGCLVRIPPSDVRGCNHSPTCLAHARKGGVAGTGQKPPDLCGAIACDTCHGILDRRISSEWDDLELDRFWLHGIVRTLSVLSERFHLVEDRR